MQGKALPEGQVTILFSDIEASTAQWEVDPVRMQDAVGLHDEMAIEALGANGDLIKRTGDGFNYVYQDPESAATASLEFQRALSAASWPADIPLRVRIGFHTGNGQPLHGDYYGPTPNRAARVADVAHGGQVVCSASSAKLIRDDLTDLAGTFSLRGIGNQEIYFVGPKSAAVQRDLNDRIKHTNLRAPVHATVGRDYECRQLSELVTSGGLVTLLGLGGIGKSRLSIDTGLQCQRAFSDGVWLCELASTSSIETVPDLIAKVLGAKRQPAMTVIESIVDFLSDKQLLLLLDNCEHVKSAVVDLVEQTAMLGGVSVLATSREPLSVPGEVIFNLTPLEIEDSGKLFRSRLSAGTDGKTTDQEILEICRAVDGVPLAVELAAGWLSVYSADEIKQRLQEGSAGFLQEKAGRQRVVLDTLAWSYRLLAPEAASLFCRLCVFRDGFTLKALESVCTGGVVTSVDADRLLAELCDKSLVLSQRQRDGSRRFRVLEVLREFGRQRLVELGEYIEYQIRHVDYFCEFVSQCDKALTGTSEVAAWQSLDHDWANIRAAYNTAKDNASYERAADIVLSLGWYSIYSVRVEVFDWALELLRSKNAVELNCYADLCGVAAISCYVTVHPDAMVWAEKGLEASPSSPSRFCRTALLGVLTNNQLDGERAEVVTSEWLAEVQDCEQDNPQEWVWAHGFRIFHLCTQQRLEEAIPLSMKLLDHARWSGSASATSVACWAHGMTQLVNGLDSANLVWEDGVSWAQSLYGGHLLTHLIVGLQLHMSAARGELQQVLKMCQSAILAAKEQHYLAGTSHLFGVTAMALTRVNDVDTAARLLGAMVANGHMPRPNVMRFVGKQLGERMEARMSTGAYLNISDAADIALEHLQQHIE